MLTGINKTNIHCIALMVKEREMIFYTFDFLSAGSDDDDEVMSDPKIFFKSTQILVYNVLRVGGHRYMRILRLLKLLWV